MANVVNVLLSLSFLRLLGFVLLSVTHAQNASSVVFQPSFLIATGPSVTAFLLYGSSNVTLNLRKVLPSNLTGSIGSPSCADGKTQWTATKEQIGKAVVRVHLRLNRSLSLCSENGTNPDCCSRPLCVLETLQVSACVGGAPQASLLVQAVIHAQLLPSNAGSDNKTVIPNQVFQPLGSCPCDLTTGVCDVRCCCDKDCSSEDLKLFGSHCLPGPFGGQVSPTPEYQCSAQSSENSPDWFPFLCVNSPPENNPFLGFFYHGSTKASVLGPSFQKAVSPALASAIPYVQESPLIQLDGQFFVIPQVILGRCGSNTPVAFLRNFKVECVTLLHSCPTGFPLQIQSAELTSQVMDGQGGVVEVDVADEVVSDVGPFITKSITVPSEEKILVCENVTLSLDYKFYWKANGLTGIALTRTIGTIISNTSMVLRTRYSAVFLNGNSMAEPVSGNPGYQVGRPVIAGIIDNDRASMQKTSINVWKPVHDGLCSSAEREAVLFGKNYTSGCLLPVVTNNLTQCNLLRETVFKLQKGLTAAAYVAKRGNPDLFTMTDWLNISLVSLNSSDAAEDTSSECRAVPSHVHVQVWTLVTGFVGSIPQREISALQISYGLSTWSLDCGGGNGSFCEESQLLSITSSVTFIDIPYNTGPPKSRFQINFTEYDCDRNDVCWPELAFPFTRYYTGEPYSLALAKGLILVFFFITASILGSPWRKIRQAWHSAAF
uniref:Tectonic family member 2 n=1 Tax=Oryzias latipes TaxID=8090 RepID=A0A3P9H6D2_ORYLA